MEHILNELPEKRYMRSQFFDTLLSEMSLSSLLIDCVETDFEFGKFSLRIWKHYLYDDLHCSIAVKFSAILDPLCLTFISSAESLRIISLTSVFLKFHMMCGYLFVMLYAQWALSM